MSGENAELAQRAFDALNRRDLATFLALMDPEVEAVPLMAVMEGGYVGHDGMRRWWDTLFDMLPGYAIEVLGVREAGDVTVSSLRARAQGPGSDAEIEHRLWTVTEWRDGKAVWWGNYRSEAEALHGATERGSMRPPSAGGGRGEVVQAAFEAYVRGDEAGMLERLDPEIVLTQFPEQPDTRPYHGPDGVLEAIADWTGTWDDYSIELVELREFGDHVVASLDQRGRGRGSGIEVEGRSYFVCTVRGGRIVRWRMFSSEEQALAALD